MCGWWCHGPLAENALKLITSHRVGPVRQTANQNGAALSNAAFPRYRMPKANTPMHKGAWPGLHIRWRIQGNPPESGTSSRRWTRN